MSTSQPDAEIALVTGANKGIGRETARRLAAEGMTVYLAARDEERGRAAEEELSAGGADVRFVRLDVTDESSIADAAKRVGGESGRVDVLVNNAAVEIARDTAPQEVTTEQLRATFEVNVFGVAAVTRLFLPLLRRSAAPRIVNLSSPLGSLQLLADPAGDVAQVGLLAYSSSKAALNAVTLLHANALRAEGIPVSAVNPGFVATDLNDHQGVLTVEQGAQAPVRLALMGAAMPSGAFLDLDAALTPLPW